MKRARAYEIEREQRWCEWSALLTLDLEIEIFRAVLYLPVKKGGRTKIQPNGSILSYFNGTVLDDVGSVCKHWREIFLQVYRRETLALVERARRVYTRQSTSPRELFKIHEDMENFPRLTGILFAP